MKRRQVVGFPLAVFWRPHRSADSAIRLFAVGDVGFIGPMGARAVADPRYPFAKVRGVWKDADLVFCNLEGPLTNSNKRTQGKKPEEVARGRDFLLKSPPEGASALKAGGIALVSLANNHAMDYGCEGLIDTLLALRSAGIACAGAGRNLEEATRPVVVRRKGKSIALLAFSSVVPPRAAATEKSCGIARLKTADDVQRAVAAIAGARKQFDFVLVSMHWGTQQQSKSNVWQRNCGHRLIDAGADAILGHHPHVLQEVECYKDKPLIYSMGNFVFGRSGVSAIYEFQLQSAHEIKLIRSVAVLIRNGRPQLKEEENGPPSSKM